MLYNKIFDLEDLTSYTSEIHVKKCVEKYVHASSICSCFVFLFDVIKDSGSFVSQPPTPMQNVPVA